MSPNVLRKTAKNIRKKTNESFNSSYYLQSFSQLCSFNSKKIFVLLWNKKFQPLIFLPYRCAFGVAQYFFLSFFRVFFSFLSTKSNFFELSIIHFFANGVWSSRADKEWVDPTKTFLLLLESQVVKYTRGHWQDNLWRHYWKNALIIIFLGNLFFRIYLMYSFFNVFFLYALIHFFYCVCMK